MARQVCRDIETIRYHFLLPDLMSFDPFSILYYVTYVHFSYEFYMLLVLRSYIHIYRLLYLCIYIRDTYTICIEVIATLNITNCFYVDLLLLLLWWMFYYN